MLVEWSQLTETPIVKLRIVPAKKSKAVLYRDTSPKAIRGQL